MGLVLDNQSITLYEKWLQSPAGRTMDEFFQSMIPALLAPHKNDRILDIGCGSGNQLLSLAKLGFHLSGVDASQEMIDIARSRLGNRCELKTGQAEDLPFSDNEFDIALLVNALEFIDDPLKALKEAGRVARRKVFICVINSLSFCCLGARLQGMFREALIKHIRPYNLWEMKSHIRQAYGKSPFVWQCSQDRFLVKCGFNLPGQEPYGSVSWPFGSMLGFSVRLNPLVRADSLPLKIKAERPFPEGAPIQNQGGMTYERGVSLRKTG